MNIFEITKEHQEWINLLSESEGELTPEQEENFFEIVKTGEDKVAALYYVWKNKQGELASVKSEIERISGIKKRLEGEMERLQRRSGQQLGGISLHWWAQKEAFNCKLDFAIPSAAELCARKMKVLMLRLPLGGDFS